ncbi:hypothetical protein FOG18_12065 [Legionella israelensis]|uniref:mevalonate kinase family protein n=1 Tax=Legionella israelensis TaxID=454 RepID=UPI00117C4AB1|nr:hypothetical protein [Legionella israelensis]QDP73245.1 hypothetical protein FOG18_12065 [Legionella israelensis]
MKWQIPAKTFLLGEYAAIAGESAILLTTSPCFELILKQDPYPSDNIHPQSPAGLWLQKTLSDKKNHLHWNDPYSLKGGLGASSAQFVAGYLATCFLQQYKPHIDNLLKSYHQMAWNGQGLRPSGYDVIAQSQQKCVYIHQNKKHMEIMPWPFRDIGFLLVHTGYKLATHHHLQKKNTLPENLSILSEIVEEGKTAFDHEDSQLLIHAVNSYHQQLSVFDFITPHSLTLINTIKQKKRVLAVKGCGAMGADVLLIISHIFDLQSISEYITTLGLTPFACHLDLYQQSGIFETL